MIWKLVNSSSNGFLFQTWICTNNQWKCCILVPQPCCFYCLSVVICKQSGKRFCFPALEEREVLGWSFSLGSFKCSQTEGCVVERVEES